MRTILKITGMHCASCKTLIEEVSRDFPGVQSCDVDQSSGRATVVHEDNMDVPGLIKEIAQLDNSYRVGKL